MKPRVYKDRRLQRQYDGSVAAYKSGARGWISPGVHGLWREDGSRFCGAGSHSAFWKGFEGFELSGGRLMYSPTSLCRMAYMAGRDCAREEVRP